MSSQREVGEVKRLVVVCGPTATGKTAVAIHLAQALGGEVVNADSRQVYRYMDVGTAKPNPAQRAAVRHHLLDVVDPAAPFTLADYLEHARAAIADVHGRGLMPIVAGGTGLYVRALVQGFAVPRVAPNEALRAELEALGAADGNAALLERLRRVDPAATTTVDAANRRRLIRAIEVAETGPHPRLVADRPLDSRAAQPSSALSLVERGGRDESGEGYDAVVVGLTGERAMLHERADRRVDTMMAAGFLDEVAALHARGYGPNLPALSGLGYRELGEYLQGRRSLGDAVQATKWATHRFIRRQFTWFRREPNIAWLDVMEGDVGARALDYVERRLASPIPVTPTGVGDAGQTKATRTGR